MSSRACSTFGPISGKNGTTPIGGLLIDSNGIMYGTTEGGGVHHSGIIYKLSVNGGGFTILHHFAGNYTSGPQGEMIFGRDGAIYGTTYGGGKFNQGAVFRITKAGVYQDIYDFKGVNQPGGSHDGANPEGRLALGADGTIYGTTSFGGSPSGYGTAWSLKKIGTKWIYAQLYIFGSPGNLPHSGLVKAPGGYYGTGAGGGKYQEGVIYKLVPPVAPDKKWTYVLLHSFTGRNVNGNIPYGVAALRQVDVLRHEPRRRPRHQQRRVQQRLRHGVSVQALRRRSEAHLSRIAGRGERNHTPAHIRPGLSTRRGSKLSFTRRVSAASAGGSG